MHYQVTSCVMRLHYALSGYIMHYQVTLCIIRVRVTMHYKGASFMRYQGYNMHYQWPYMHYQGYNMRYQGYNMRHQVTLCIISARVLCVIRVRMPRLDPPPGSPPWTPPMDPHFFQFFFSVLDHRSHLLYFFLLLYYCAPLCIFTVFFHFIFNNRG